MSVHLRKRKNSDGTTTLYLDIYTEGKRYYEFLKDIKLKKASSPEDRIYNNGMLKTAQSIWATRSQQVADKRYKIESKISALSWLEKYINSYQKKDKRNMSGARGQFETFLKKNGIEDILMRDITESIVIDYRDYLADICQGEGGKSYFARFKKMIKQAHKDDVILKNPCDDVRPPSGKARIKDILTIDEIQLLANTPTEAIETKQAFLLCCLTGLRWVDVNLLKWSDIKNNAIQLRQAKTGEDLNVQLNDSAQSLLSQVKVKNDFVFKLPSASGTNRTLDAWVKRAGISKNITWHCARHSFGTNLIYHGADVYVTSKLLGHSSLKHTERYVRAANDLKQQAVNKLPSISF